MTGIEGKPTGLSGITPDKFPEVFDAVQKQSSADATPVKLDKDGQFIFDAERIKNKEQSKEQSLESNDEKSGGAKNTNTNNNTNNINVNVGGAFESVRKDGEKAGKKKGKKKLKKMQWELDQLKSQLDTTSADKGAEQEDNKDEVMTEAHQNDVQNMDDWKVLQDQKAEQERNQKRQEMSTTFDEEHRVETEEEINARKERESDERVAKAHAVIERSKRTVEQMRQTREMLDAKKAFENAHQAELEKRHGGKIRGAFNRWKDKYSNSFEMSDDVKGLQEKYFALQAERTLSRYNRVIDSAPEEKRDEMRNKMFEKLKAKTERDYDAEIQRKVDANETFTPEEREKSFKRIKATKEWIDRKPAATRAAIYATIGTTAALAMGTVAVAGTGAYGARRMIGILVGGAAATAVIGGLSKREQKSAESLLEQLDKEEQSISPDDMLSLQRMARKRPEELDAHQRRFLYGKMLAGVTTALIVGASTSEVIGQLTTPGAVATMQSVDTSQFERSGGGPMAENNTPPIDGSLDGVPTLDGQLGIDDSLTTDVSGSSTEGATEAAAVSGPSLEIRSINKGEGGLSYMQSIREAVRTDLGISVDDPIPTDAPKAYKELLDGNLHDAAKKFGMFDPTGVGNTGEESFRFNFDAANPENNGRVVIENGEIKLFNGDDTYSLFRPDAGVTAGDMQGDMIDSNFDKATYQTPPQASTPNFEVPSEPSSNPPAGVDPAKLHFNASDAKWYALAEYANDGEVQAAGLDTLGVSATGSPSLENVPHSQFTIPTADDIAKGLAFERDGRYFYYNHDNYPVGNPFGEELPIPAGDAAPEPTEQLNSQSQEFLAAKSMLLESNVSESGVVALENHELEMSKFDLGQLGLIPGEFGLLESNTTMLPDGKTIAVHGFSKGDMNIVMKVLPNDVGQETIYIHNGDNPIPMQTYGVADGRVNLIRGLNYIKENLNR